MSALAKGTVKIVYPRTHVVSNYGPHVQSLTFSYNGRHHTINRNGNHNVIVYDDMLTDGMVTVTNRCGEAVRRMHKSAFQILTAVSTAGVVYTRGVDF